MHFHNKGMHMKVEDIKTLEEAHTVIAKLESICTSCYVGLGLNYDLPERFLDVLCEPLDASNEQIEGLLPVATPAPPKLCIALPDYEKRRIVIASDEVIDGERLVCVAIKDAP